MIWVCPTYSRKEDPKLVRIGETDLLGLAEFIASSHVARACIAVRNPWDRLTKKKIQRSHITRW